MESTFHDTESELVIRINAASDAECRRRLQPCLDIPRWYTALADLRPFADDDAIRAAVFSAAAPLTASEIDRALQVHPRIGERPAGDDEHAAHARTEQAGVDVTEADTLRRIRSGNIAYERRFGRVFLVRAAGRDASAILAALDERLTNDPETELRTVEQQLREIAALRVEKAFADA